MNYTHSFRLTLVLITALFSSLTFIQPIFAKKPCAKDINQFCAHVKGDREAVVQCLIKHKDQLSKRCQKRGLKHQRKTKAKAACQSDIKTFCKDVKRGQGRIVQCLSNHYDQLSPECKKQAHKKKNHKKKNQSKKKRILKALKGLRTACKSDVTKFCSSITSNEKIKKRKKLKKIFRCLKKNKDDLEPQCLSKLKKIRKKIKRRGKRGKRAFKRLKKACKQDFKNYCKGVKPGKGRVKSCLREHKDKLSQTCRDFIVAHKQKAQMKENKGEGKGVQGGEGDELEGGAVEDDLEGGEEEVEGEGEAIEGEAIEGKAIEGKAIEGKAIEGKVIERDKLTPKKTLVAP